MISTSLKQFTTHRWTTTSRDRGGQFYINELTASDVVETGFTKNTHTHTHINVFIKFYSNFM